MYKNSIKYALHVSGSSLSHLQTLVTNMQSTYYWIIRKVRADLYNLINVY